ncbi:MAG: phytanoyl-CoA dioxygenase family protein [Acidimicrobiales bacterium]
MTGARRRVPFLADRRADRSLDRFGFAIVDVVGPEPAAALLAAHRELRGSAGEGFEADLNNVDPAYRRRVAELGTAHLGPALARLVVGHEPFLWNFLVKWPNDPDDLYVHRDWMFVDEPSGARSYTIWTALQDIQGHNGQLRVLPGSHRVPSGLSGTDLSPGWLRHEGLIEERMRAIPLRAGQGVVIDHALVHSSHPNHTDAPRVAMGCGFRPAGSGLVHFRRSGTAGAVRYQVEDRFFVDHTPADLMAAAPDEPGAAVPVVEVDLERAELAAALDRAVSRQGIGSRRRSQRAAGAR